MTEDHKTEIMKTYTYTVFAHGQAGGESLEWVETDSGFGIWNVSTQTMEHGLSLRGMCHALSHDNCTLTAKGANWLHQNRNLQIES